MSWLSSFFTPRKRSSTDSDDGFLGSVFKRLKAEIPLKQPAEQPSMRPEDSVCYTVNQGADLAPLMSSILVPRPLVLVAWKQGDLSITSTTFCSLVSEQPPYISIGLAKDVLPDDQSIEGVGHCKEFTVSVVSEWLEKAAAKTAGTYELPEDTADLRTGLTTTSAEQVGVPIISEAAASLECKLHHKVNIKDRDGEIASVVVVAEVLCVHVNKAVLEDPDNKSPVVDAAKLKPVLNTTAATPGPAISPPASPVSPDVKESAPALSPLAADTAQEVAEAVVDALAKESTAQGGDLLAAREELADTVLVAVESVLDPENEVEEEPEEELEVEVEEESDVLDDSSESDEIEEGPSSDDIENESDN